MATLGDSHQADATVGEDGTDALDQPPDVDREPSGQLQHDHGPGRGPAQGLVQAGARCHVDPPLVQLGGVDPAMPAGARQ